MTGPGTRTQGPGPGDPDPGTRARDHPEFWIQVALAKTGIRDSGSQSDKCCDPNWLWLLALANSGSQHIARVQTVGI